MPGACRIAQLLRVTVRAVHPYRLVATAAALVLALLAIPLVMLVASHGTTRAGLLAQLQRPATYAATNVGPRPVAVSLPAGDYRLGLRVTPNRAAAHNTVTVALSRHGLPVRGARVTVVYSMPAMDMNDGLTSTLAASGAGRGVLGSRAGARHARLLGDAFRSAARLRPAVQPDRQRPASLTVPPKRRRRAARRPPRPPASACARRGRPCSRAPRPSRPRSPSSRTRSRRRDPSSCPAAR